jgi:hypothetical protein
LYLGFDLYASINSGESFNAPANLVQGFSGINLTNSFISLKGIQYTLQTSLTAARAANVQKVHICAT